MPSDAPVRRPFEEGAARARRACESGEGGRAVAALLTRCADDVLAGLLNDGCASLGRDTSGVALCAVGGYGRGELAPGSDIDVLLAYQGWSQTDVTELVRLVVYPLWDSGRKIGHRVRTIPEAVRILERTDEAAAALDTRLVAGDHALFLELEGAVLGRLHRTRAGFFRRLVEENHARHGRFGHAGHLLEPDIRDSAGGLRDIHTLRWASRLLPCAGGLEGLVALGYLSDADRQIVEEATEFLFHLRVHLHFQSGRQQDRLYLADQDRLAQRVGIADTDATVAGDQLMREVYRRARDVDAIVSSCWERITHPSGRGRGSGARRLLRRGRVSSGDGWVIRDGRLEVTAVPHPYQDPAGWLHMFAQTIPAGVPMGRASVNRLQSLVAAGGPVPWTTAAWQELSGILASGRAGVRVMESIDDAGLLAALVPEWETVHCRPQRNLYHRYTVDVHLLETVGELAESRGIQDAPDVADAWSRVPDPQRLLLAGLLHDIGKGRGGDHSVVGAELAGVIAGRIGLDAGAVQDVVFCVREHLTLPELATRRDLADERTATEAAVRAGSAERLAMLYLLARADALATGPEAWSPFRAALVRELYVKAMHVVEGGPEQIAGAAELGARRRAELVKETGWPAEEVDRTVDLLGLPWLLAVDPAEGAVQLEMTRTPPGPDEVRASARRLETADELVVVASDRPGLLAAVTGVLAARGVDVLRADIWTRADGVALEVFRVAAPDALSDQRCQSIRQDVEAVLRGELDLDAALARKSEQSLPRGRTAVPVPTHVVVDNRASDFYTVVEVHAADRTGLLRTVTKALADAGCDLRLAKVATYGIEVVDVFYVRDLEGQKIEGDEAVERIEKIVLERLAG